MLKERSGESGSLFPGWPDLLPGQLLQRRNLKREELQEQYPEKVLICENQPEGWRKAAAVSWRCCEWRCHCSPPAPPSTVQVPTAVRGALGVAQVSLALPNPEAILGHHLLAFSLLSILKMSISAGCQRHPKPGSEETSLTFPGLFSECAACFFWERGAALGPCEKLRYVREGFLLGTRKGDADAKRSAMNGGGWKKQDKKSKKREKKSLQALARNKLEVFPTTALGEGAFYAHQAPV